MIIESEWHPELFSLKSAWWAQREPELTWWWAYPSGEQAGSPRAVCISASQPSLMGPFWKSHGWTISHAQQGAVCTCRRSLAASRERLPAPSASTGASLPNGADVWFGSSKWARVLSRFWCLTASGGLQPMGCVTPTQPPAVSHLHLVTSQSSRAVAFTVVCLCIATASLHSTWAVSLFWF